MLWCCQCAFKNFGICKTGCQKVASPRRDKRSPPVTNSSHLAHIKLMAHSPRQRGLLVSTEAYSARHAAFQSLTVVMCCHDRISQATTLAATEVVWFLYSFLWLLHGFCMTFVFSATSGFSRLPCSNCPREASTLHKCGS